MRRFWNQIFTYFWNRLFNITLELLRDKLSFICPILTWVSVRLRLNARLRRSHTDKYRVVLNLFSKDTSCSYVNAVRALLNEYKIDYCL